MDKETKKQTDTGNYTHNTIKTYSFELQKK